MISQYLEEDGQVVCQIPGVADMILVQCALQYATEGSEVNVNIVADELLQLLMYHCMETEHGKYIFSVRGQKNLKIWNNY